MTELILDGKQKERLIDVLKDKCYRTMDLQEISEINKLLIMIGVKPESAFFNIK